MEWMDGRKDNRKRIVQYFALRQTGLYGSVNKVIMITSLFF